MQLPTSVLTWIFWIIPLVIAFLAVCVSAYAVSSNKKVALAQSYFAQKAKAYENFWNTFAAAAYAPENPSLRAELTKAFYCASMYAPEDVNRQLSAFMDKLLRARSRHELASLDDMTPELFELLNHDLTQAWKRR